MSKDCDTEILHPTDEDLIDYFGQVEANKHEDELVPEEFKAIDEHLTTCDRCFKRMYQLGDPPPPL